MANRQDIMDFHAGEDVVIAPSLSTEDAKATYGEVNEVFPYLRFMADPNA